jgi:hypothetical protein
MADPAEIDIIVDRNVRYDDNFTFLGVAWTGSTFKIQVRLIKDTTGTPLLNWTSPDGVTLTYAGTATVASHVSAGRLSGTGDDSIYSMINPATGVPYVGSDNLTLSAIFLDLLANAFPFPEERGDDLTTFYDIVRIPASGNNELVMRGKFIVRAGVTIP